MKIFLGRFDSVIEEKNHEKTMIITWSQAAAHTTDICMGFGGNMDQGHGHRHCPQWQQGQDITKVAVQDTFSYQAVPHYHTSPVLPLFIMCKPFCFSSLPSSPPRTCVAVAIRLDSTEGRPLGP